MNKKSDDHRIRVTKMLIRRAFTDLLKTKPVGSISVKELCASAGINRGTFYAHYSDIYDLLKKIEDETLTEFKTAMEPLIGELEKGISPVKVTSGIFRCLKENADICAVTLGQYGDKDFAARLINEGRKSCVASYAKFFTHASERSIEYFYSFASSGCMGILTRWFEEGMITDIDEIAAMAEDFILSAATYFGTPATQDAEVDQL